MKLYDLELSGNCYKVRLFAALAGIDLTLVQVDFMSGDHKKTPVIDLNPWGELPVLEDGDTVLRDSQAILVYLAGAYGGHAWWPDSPELQGDVMQWLSVAANEIQHGPNVARLVDFFKMDFDKQVALTTSERILGLMEHHLNSNDWLAVGRPTIADCAVYPYVAIAAQGGIDLAPYKAINRWMESIKALPGYISMPGIA